MAQKTNRVRKSIGVQRTPSRSKDSSANDEEIWMGGLIAVVVIVLISIGVYFLFKGDDDVDVNCEGTWSACTAACEEGSARTWTTLVAPSGSGTACPTTGTGPDCAAGHGTCPDVADVEDQETDQVYNKFTTTNEVKDGSKPICDQYDKDGGEEGKYFYDNKLHRFKSCKYNKDILKHEMDLNNMYMPYGYGEVNNNAELKEIPLSEDDELGYWTLFKCYNKVKDESDAKGIYWRDGCDKSINANCNNWANCFKITNEISGNIVDKKLTKTSYNDTLIKFKDCKDLYNELGPAPCCEDNNCNNGIPQECSSECGEKWLPYNDKCKEYVDNNVEDYKDLASKCKYKRFISLNDCDKSDQVGGSYTYDLYGGQDFIKCPEEIKIENLTKDNIENGLPYKPDNYVYLEENTPIQKELLKTTEISTGDEQKEQLYNCYMEVKNHDDAKGLQLDIEKDGRTYNCYKITNNIPENKADAELYDPKIRNRVNQIKFCNNDGKCQYIIANQGTFEHTESRLELNHSLLLKFKDDSNNDQGSGYPPCRIANDVEVCD